MLVIVMMMDIMELMTVTLMVDMMMIVMVIFVMDADIMACRIFEQGVLERNLGDLRGTVMIDAGGRGLPMMSPSGNVII